MAVQDPTHEHQFNREITDSVFACECGETVDITDKPTDVHSSACPIDTGRSQY